MGYERVVFYCLSCACPGAKAIILSFFLSFLSFSFFLFLFCFCFVERLTFCISSYHYNFFWHYQVRVYAPPDRLNQTQFALEVANISVDLYTELFDIPYPLPKLG